MCTLGAEILETVVIGGAVISGGEGRGVDVRWALPAPWSASTRRAMELLFIVLPHPLGRGTF